MNMASGQLGYGATLSVSGTALPNITEINMPALDVSYVEATHLQSPNRYREWVPGLRDAGDASFKQLYTEAALTYALAQKGVEQPFKISFPDGAQCSFQASLSKSECDLTPDAVAIISHTMRVLGQVTLA